MALAVMVSTTTNVVVLALAIALVVFTVMARRPRAPWSKSLKLYLGLGAFIVAVRMVLHILVGAKSHDVTILSLLRIPLPSWAAGIQLLGDVGLGGLLAAGLEGVRLATMLLCFGAANSLANPRKLLASLPHAVRDLGTATVIALTIAPQLVHSVQRVRTAQVLRGEGSRRRRGARIAMPVLHDSLERSVALAAAMEARGFGAVSSMPRRQRQLIGAGTLVGVVGACIGLFFVLSTPGGWPLLIASLLLCAVTLWLSGRGMRRTQYRPQLWGWAETVTAVCGVVAAVAVRWIFAAHPQALSTPTAPLAAPDVPWQLPLVMLIAAVPAVVTPDPNGGVARRGAETPAHQSNYTPDGSHAPAGASKQAEQAARVRELLRGSST